METVLRVRLAEMAVLPGLARAPFQVAGPPPATWSSSGRQEIERYFGQSPMRFASYVIDIFCPLESIDIVPV
jgi:hypothetical protein